MCDAFYRNRLGTREFLLPYEYYNTAYTTLVQRKKMLVVWRTVNGTPKRRTATQGCPLTDWRGRGLFQRWPVGLGVIGVPGMYEWYSCCCVSCFSYIFVYLYTASAIFFHVFPKNPNAYRLTTAVTCKYPAARVPILMASTYTILSCRRHTHPSARTACIRRYVILSSPEPPSRAYHSFEMWSDWG